MKQVTSLSDWNELRDSLGESPIGFVPTMGALHAGHLSLIETSLQQNSFTVVSIYVNPTQFDQSADLAAYPQPLAGDIRMLREAGVDAVLTPSYSELYPDEYNYRVTETALSRQLCGEHRPGHFDGMLTVVMKLLNLVRADRAYFGEKDFQQLQLVRGMVRAFFIPTEIVGCSIARESDGLAMSSRNHRLSPTERRSAVLLYQALQQGKTAAAARHILEQAGFNVDYVEDHAGRRLAAARLGEVRLIDNIPLATSPELQARTSPSPHNRNRQSRRGRNGSSLLFEAGRSSAGAGDTDA